MNHDLGWVHVFRSHDRLSGPSCQNLLRCGIDVYTLALDERDQDWFRGDFDVVTQPRFIARLADVSHFLCS